MRDYISLSPGKINDALAILALKHRDQIQARNRAVIKQNMATTTQWLAEHADIMSWIPPQGGLLGLLHYKLNIPSADLAKKLAEEYSVMLAPGAAFGFEHYLRLGIGQEPTIFAEGLTHLGTCLKHLYMSPS